MGAGPSVAIDWGVNVDNPNVPPTETETVEAPRRPAQRQRNKFSASSCSSCSCSFSYLFFFTEFGSLFFSSAERCLLLLSLLFGARPLNVISSVR